MNEIIDPPILDIDPLDPEAPIHHLLSVKHNPNVLKMTTEELNALITRIRTVATSPQTMSSVLQGESKRRKPKSEAQKKREALLESL